MSTTNDLIIALWKCSDKDGPKCEGCPMNIKSSPSECFGKVARAAHDLLIDNRKEIRDLEGKVRFMSEGYETKLETNANGLTWYVGPKGEHEEAEKAIETQEIGGDSHD